VFEKMGLDALLKSAISSQCQSDNKYVDFGGRTFRDVFKFNRQDVPAIAKMDMNLPELELYETIREIRWTRALFQLYESGNVKDV
jgi:hypothetical protein